MLPLRERRIPLAYDLGARALLALPFLAWGLWRLTAAEAAIEALSGAGLAFPGAINYASAGIELMGGVFLVLGFQVWATAAVLILYLLPVTFLVHGLPAHEDPAQALQVLRDLALAGGLLLLAGVHRRDAPPSGPER